jgi:hypothetical protein
MQKKDWGHPDTPLMEDTSGSFSIAAYFACSTNPTEVGQGKGGTLNAPLAMTFSGSSSNSSYKKTPPSPNRYKWTRRAGLLNATYK